MDEHIVVKGKRKRPARALRWLLLVVAAVAMVFRDKVQKDVALIMAHSRLFVGIAMFSIGILMFQSDKYCDGNPSVYAACTRPSTYYYYPWWAIILVVLGSFLVVLWFLRKNK